uniref:Uncharacterized protein n=1 Tax=Elaeophora elaphi TaxID=1147741 RepID=A0A0R3RKF1_9BILA
MAAYCTKLLEMENANLYNAYLKLVSYTSTLDILIIMLYRQKDITAEVLHRFPFLFCFRILLQPLLKPKYAVRGSQKKIKTAERSVKGIIIGTILFEERESMRHQTSEQTKQINLTVTIDNVADE